MAQIVLLPGDTLKFTAPDNVNAVAYYAQQPVGQSYASPGRAAVDGTGSAATLLAGPSTGAVHLVRQVSMALASGIGGTVTLAHNTGSTDFVIWTGTIDASTKVVTL